MDINEITRKRIFSLVERKATNDANFAIGIGVSKQVVSHWRCGVSTSFTKYLPDIASYFKVSIDYLLGNEQEEKPRTDRERLNQECVDIMNSLPDDLREVAHEHLKSLATLADKGKKK